MACACDTHPCARHDIPAGLAHLPRSAGGFPGLRHALLEAIGREPALRAWRAREPGDFGVMLAEMFAYMGDVTGFYDAFLADGSYLGPAASDAGVRRLVALLGYVPRPAYGAQVWIAAEADGVRTIALPRGTAFRSGAFPGSAPQLFELGGDATVEPRINRLAVDRVPATALPNPLGGISVIAATVRVGPGALVVLAAGSTLLPAHVAAARPMLLRIRRAVTMLDFAAPLALPAGAAYAGARLLRGGARCGAWKLTPGSGESAVLSGAELSLDGVVGIQPGDVVAIEAGNTAVARRVTRVARISYTVLAGLTSTITDAAKNKSILESPAIKADATRLTLDSALPFAATDVPSLVVHYAMSDAATIHAPLKDMIGQADPIHLPGLIDPPRAAVAAVALQDAHGEGWAGAGALDAAAHAATIAGTPGFDAELMQPVQLFGNVFAATRGESVRGERLGAGDASQPWQSFLLKKKPLTYLAAANMAGRVSTLVVRVGGIEWREVESFYGQRDDAQVYVVRTDGEGQAEIVFGGGARAPTGATIIADYRFGAGAAGPPADSVRQLAHPVAGLRRVTNILPAFGGADAEGAAEIGTRGPASALLLGRAISLVDIEAAAASRTGVRAARAAWRWDAAGQRPAAIVRYIGDPQLAPPIAAALRALAEEDAPITVLSAPPQSARLDADIEADPAMVADVIADAVGRALFAAAVATDPGGLLRPERLGPDGVVFASIVIRAIMETPGVVGLRALSFDGSPFTDVGKAPAAGSYFDFAGGGVRINGRLAG